MGLDNSTEIQAAMDSQDIFNAEATGRWLIKNENGWLEKTTLFMYL